MTAFTPGTTLFIPSGLEGEHLFVVVLGPKVLPGYLSCDQFLLVPICSAVPGIIHECPVAVGSHPFIIHDSYADFAHAEIKSLAELERYVGNLFRLHESMMDGQMLQTIIKALPDSKRLRRFVKKDFLGIP